jgi:hypothetical protein
MGSSVLQRSDRAYMYIKYTEHKKMISDTLMLSSLKQNQEQLLEILLEDCTLAQDWESGNRAILKSRVPIKLTSNIGKIEIGSLCMLVTIWM